MRVAHSHRGARCLRPARTHPRRSWDDAKVSMNVAGRRRPRAPWRLAGAILGGLLAGGASPVVLAHGAVPDDPPSLAGLLLDWSIDPVLGLPLLAVALIWIRAVRRVDRLHPANQVPRRRSAAFLGGLLAIALALQSGIERYDTTLFSIHMVQHLLLTMVAAPLIALGAPVTLLLRVAGATDRRRWILPVLHSRAVRVIGHPVVATLVFAGVMWGTHFSPLFDRALEDRLAHDLEHVLFLGTALLFWWPAVGLDPSPYRLSHPVRILYTFLQMPQNTFLAMAIIWAPAVRYPHYASLDAAWLPDPLADQQLAAGIMWLGGDLIFLAALFALMLGWSRREELDTAAAERRADQARAGIRLRETGLATRRAAISTPIAGAAGASGAGASAAAPAGAGRPAPDGAEEPG